MLRTRCTFHLALGAALVLAVAGCSANAAKPDACKLVAPSTAAAILGAKVTVKPVDTSGAEKDEASLCSYQTTKLHGGFLLIAAKLDVKNLADEVARQKESAVKSSVVPGVTMPTPEARDIPGIGDAAFLVTTDFFFQLHVFAKGDKIVVNRNLKPTPEAIDQTEKIAKAAVANLP